MLYSIGRQRNSSKNQKRIFEIYLSWALFPINVMMQKKEDKNEINQHLLSAYYVQSPVPMSIPERSHSHMLASFHHARFIRGDLPTKPVESHTDYTKRGGARAIRAIRCTVPITGESIDGEASLGLKTGSYTGSAHTVEQESHWTAKWYPWYSQAQVSNSWSSEFL